MIIIIEDNVYVGEAAQFWRIAKSVRTLLRTQPRDTVELNFLYDEIEGCLLCYDCQAVLQRLVKLQKQLQTPALSLVTGAVAGDGAA